MAANPTGAEHIAPSALNESGRPAALLHGMPFRLLARTALLAALGFSNPDEADLRCPAGSILRESATESRCETPSGVGEGPFWARREDGTLRFWGTAHGDQIEGRWIAWHPNSRKSIEASYQHGELVGAFRMWAENGRLVYSGEHDATGAMDGTWTRWWPNGKRRARFGMRHGDAHGPVDTWWENGAHKMQGRREDGRREGRWTWWNEEGRVSARCRYERDVVVEGTCGAS